MYLFFNETVSDSYLFLVGIQVDVWKADSMFNYSAWILCGTCVTEPPAGRLLTVHSTRRSSTVSSEMML